MRKLIIGIILVYILLVGCQVKDFEIDNQEPVKSIDEPESKEDVTIKDFGKNIAELINIKTDCGNYICELDKNEDIDSCNIDCKKLGVLLKDREPIDFFPQRIGEFELIEFSDEYYNKYSKYSEYSWVEHTFDYLEGADKKIIYEYLEEDVSKYGNSPLWGEGEGKPIKNNIVIQDKYHARYARGENITGYTFNIRITKYHDDYNFNKVLERKPKIKKETLFSMRKDQGNVRLYEEPLLNTKILDYTTWYFRDSRGTDDHEFIIFLPEISTTIEIDFTDYFMVGTGSSSYLDSFYSFLEHSEAEALVNQYIMWLADKTNEYTTILEEDKAKRYEKEYISKVKEFSKKEGETISRDRSNTILYISEEDWKTTINLDGFQEYDDGQTLLSRFLYQIRESDGMFISIFGEKIDDVSDSESCKDNYYPFVLDYTTTLVNENNAEVGEISESERDDFTIISYDSKLPFEGRKIKVKNLHAYRYYDEYCLSFNMAQFDSTGDMESFYNILDSVQITEVKDKPFESDDVRYVILTIDYLESLFK